MTGKMYNFCTICTASHLFKVKALFNSLIAYHDNICLHVLLTDADTPNDISSNLKCYTTTSLNGIPTAKQLTDKYSKNPDALRWSLKPVFLHYLLEKHAIGQIIYLDNDIFFFNEYKFLFDSFTSSRFLLTPHWRCAYPETDEPQFLDNFTDGLYNAGFVGARNDSLDILKWWAKMCLYECEKNKAKGFFVDQRYLDLVPVNFEDVEIIRHQGCNVAYWNRLSNIRSLKEGKVFINGRWPLVFVHFTDKTIETIDSGEDYLLKEQLRKYQVALLKMKEETHE